MNSKTSWTVSIIAQYDELSQIVVDAYNELEESILVQTKNPEVEYFVFFYEQRRKTALAKKLIYGPHGVPRFKVIKEYGEIDLYDGVAISQFLKEFSAQSKNSKIKKNHILITWGHGSGYGFFEEPDSKGLKPTTIHASHANYYNLTKELSFFKAQFAISDKFIDYEQLYEYYGNKASELSEWIDDLKTATKVISVLQLSKIIKATLGKADVLLAMNCYMQTFEACYILKDAVEVFIASQTTISFYGYNYIRLFELIQKSPNASLDAIAMNVTSSYFIKHNEEPLRSILHENERDIVDFRNVAISAILLRGFEDLNILLNNLSSQIMKLPETPTLQKCIKARKKCLSVKREGVVDFRNFFTEFSRYFDEDIYDYKKHLISYQYQLYNLRTKHQLAAYQPGSVFEYEITKDLLPSISPQFFSIFFPLNVSSDVFYQSGILFGYGQVFKKSKWFDLIKKINGVKIK